MADVVNLRAARKRRAREASAQASDENRRRFGRTKAEKARVEAERDLTTRGLEGAALRKGETPRKD